jgi:hypothetical protein
MASTKLVRRLAQFRAPAGAVLLLTALACNVEKAAEPNPQPVAASTAAVKFAARTPASGIAFGDFHLDENQFKSPYTGALRVIGPLNAKQVLDKARAAGVRVVVSLTTRDGMSERNGNFSMTKWKKQVNRFRNFDLNSYVADGTILGHYLIDEPACAPCHGGKAIPGSMIEELARYSKSLWPNMPTGARAPATHLPNMRYQSLDFAWAQWEGPLHLPSYRMTPEQFRDSETAAAKARGLGLIFGINYLDAGNGSSRIGGTYKNATSIRVNRWQMTAEEVKSVGAVLAAAPYGCAMINWKSEPNFDARSGVMAAKRSMAAVAASHASQTCAPSLVPVPFPPPPPPPVDSTPVPPVDSTPVPPDPVVVPPDTIVLPPDTTQVPTDTTPAPPDSGVPVPSANGSGIVFGDFHLSDKSFGSPYTGTLRTLGPSSAKAFLAKAQVAGVQVIVALAADRTLNTNPNGSFNLTKWKQAIDRFKVSGLEPYIANHTILGHYLVHGPECAACWGGQKISASTLEEMARYSKAIWPALATGVGAAASVTPQASYTYLDFALAQWEGPHIPSFGLTPEQFRDRETAAAKARGLGVMFGLNYLDGGSGSSGIAGTFANAASPSVNRWAMSAAEVMRVGAVLAAEPYACGFLSWKSNPAYDARPGIMDAKRFVASVARSRASASCVR